VQELRAGLGVGGLHYTNALIRLTQAEQRAQPPPPPPRLNSHSASLSVDALCWQARMGTHAAAAEERGQRFRQRCAS
jgi:hypothetical protein